MKSYTLLLILFCSSLASLAQNIAVTFSGTSSAIIIDSINATNLATDESISLPGDATLILSSNTSISDLISYTDFSLVYPNPFPGSATIQTFSDESRNINISILDLSGRTIIQTTAYVNPGVCSFYLALASPGIYFACLETSEGVITRKLICTSSGTNNKIQFLDSYSKLATRNSQLKSSFTLGYSTGDIIQYECFSSDFSTIFTDSPIETKTYEIEFPPIAQLNINPVEGNIEDRITLDATGCADAETPADELEVRWDFNGDSIWDTDFDQTKYIVYMFPRAGTFNVGLQVRDLSGKTDSISVPVTINYLSFTDSRDNKVYHYKRIGDQYWMVENLAYLPEVSPSSENSLTAKHYYVYGYESSTPVLAKQHPNYKEHGVLYNWPASLDACPEGWHLPSDEEWKVLELNLGMSEDDIDIRIGGAASRLSGSVGGQLKEEGTAHWDSPNEGATNSSGFTALGTGARDVTEGFTAMGIISSFWTSTEFENATPHAYFRQLIFSSDGVIRYVCWTSYGFSVRCIKD